MHMFCCSCRWRLAGQGRRERGERGGTHLQSIAHPVAHKAEFTVVLGAAQHVQGEPEIPLNIPCAHSIAGCDLSHMLVCDTSGVV